MEAPDGRSNRDPVSFLRPDAVEPHHGRGGGGSVGRRPEPDRGNARRCCEPRQMVTATANRWLPSTIGLRRAYVAWGEQMGLTGSGWIDPHGTVQVKCNGALRASRGSVMTPQRLRLSAPVVHSSEPKVLAGWRAVGTTSIRLAAGRTANAPRGEGCCVLAICRISVLTDAAIVYRLARESTGIDVSDYANARSAR